MGSTPNIEQPAQPRRERPAVTDVKVPVPEDGGAQAREHQRRQRGRSGRSALRIPDRTSKGSGVNTSYG